MVEIDDERFRGVVAMHRDDGRAAEPGRFDADEPRRIVLGEHLDIVGLRGLQPMQHDPARAMVLILFDVEKRLESRVQTTSPVAPLTRSARSC